MSAPNPISVGQRCPAAQIKPAYIIRWRGFPVKFAPIDGREIYKLVPSWSATTFATEAAAIKRAGESHLRPKDLTVEPLQP